MFRLKILFTFLLPLLSIISSISIGSVIPDRAETTPSIFNYEKWVDLTSVQPSDSNHVKPASDSYKDANTLIFVGISHYRDSRCATTLKNLFTKAKYPQRIRVGIVQQRHTEDDNFKCQEDYCMANNHLGQCMYEKQIKTIEFTHQMSRGPNYGRSFFQHLIKEEEFCFQIDAHSDLVSNWDVELLEMWGQTQNEYAILSTKPPDISELSQSSHNPRVPHLCQATVDERGMIVNLPPTQATHLNRPILASLYSEAFAFGKCHAFKKVPNDPNLQVFYDGDEFARFMRFWTKGYDVYTPHKIVVGHDYYHKLPVIRAKTKDIDPMEWTSNGMTKDFTRSLYDTTLERLNSLYGTGLVEELEKGADNADAEKTIMEKLLMLGKYGLGRKRSLFQFMEFTGIDTIKKEIFGDRCKELAWVPYLFAENDPAADEGDLFGFAPETIDHRADNIPLLYSKDLAFYSLKDYMAGLSSAVAPSNSTEAVPVQEVPAAVPVPLISESAHRGGELWYIFQFVDTFLEKLINEIDLDVGYGHGHRVMRTVLLFLPVFVLLIYLAFSVLLSPDRQAKPARSSDKQI